MNALKTLRLSRGMNQGDIADILGITRAAYTNIENGKRQLDNNNLILLADYFGVSTDFLLGRVAESDETQKEPAVKDSELDPELISLMESLSEEDFQRVKDFVAGLKAARGEPTSHQP